MSSDVAHKHVDAGDVYLQELPRSWQRRRRSRRRGKRRPSSRARPGAPLLRRPARGAVASGVSGTMPSALALAGAGEEAAKKLSKELGVEVRCDYLGQPNGLVKKRNYRREPADWRVPAGEWRSQQTVSFVWVFDGDEDNPHVTEQLYNNVVARGVRPPETIMASHRGAATLQQELVAAAAAAEEMHAAQSLQEFGVRFRCRCPSQEERKRGRERSE